MDVAPTDAPTIEGQQLASWSVMRGGTHICLGLSASDGATYNVVLPFDIVSGLMMTLPSMLRAALTERFPQGSFRVVQWLGKWQLEQQAGEQSLILTMATTDDFEVAFALTSQHAEALAKALLAAQQDNDPPIERRPN